jgi:CTP:molybdopterin cytidylyltransferase MocA
MAMTLIVLAATMGNKYGGLKQLEGIGPNGETILDFSVYDAVRVGFDKIVFVIIDILNKNSKNWFQANTSTWWMWNMFIRM